MSPRAAYALLSVLAPVAIWHHVAWRRGSAYLLLDLAAPSWAVAAAHVVGLLAGASAAMGGRALSPWRGPRLLLALGASCAAAQIGAFFFLGTAHFSSFALSTSAALGALFGALSATQARALPSLSFRREELLDALSVTSLALGVALAIAWLLAADRLGPLRAGLLLSIGCCFIAHLGASQLAPQAPASRLTRRAAAGTSYALAALVALVEPLTPIAEAARAPDPPVYARSGVLARVVLTSGRGAFQLYVDGLLRLSTLDASRRAEATVHPAMLAAARRRRVLVLGGGDGASLREVLRYPDRGEVTLVEPDEPLLRVGASSAVLLRENGGSLSAPGVRALHGDPLKFLEESPERYDVIIADLLDPEGPRRSKLFTAYFYGLLREHLDEGGVAAVAAAASPLGQRRAFWCVVRTLEHAGLSALPYRVGLPSWGVFGLVLASRSPLSPPEAEPPPGLLAFDRLSLRELFRLAPDEGPVDAEPNLLHRQILLKYRAEER